MIFVRSALFTGTSRPLIFHGFRGITDQTFSKTGSKFKKCELTLNVDRLLVQKFGIPTPKARKIQKMFKSLVNTSLVCPRKPWRCDEVQNYRLQAWTTKIININSLKKPVT